MMALVWITSLVLLPMAASVGPAFVSTNKALLPRTRSFASVVDMDGGSFYNVTSTMMTPVGAWVQPRQVAKPPPIVQEAVAVEQPVWNENQQQTSTSFDRFDPPVDNQASGVGVLPIIGGMFLAGFFALSAMAPMASVEETTIIAPTTTMTTTTTVQQQKTATDSTSQPTPYWVKEQQDLEDLDQVTGWVTGFDSF
ncbi:expressed unknown protein [Seminavis robusta]|uniref:Transmembrane protein n=1 Tax=Seminavis robusta TaxID=568900 RepID=A0A9N8H8U8_9STRA|nr:expressed unknown protein [Seminavis robusta]|eukprot:Sro231_g093700.1 n/a (196) ;mRNA; r:74281-74868